MTIGELIERLKPLNPNVEVRLAELIQWEGPDGEPVLHYPQISDITYDETVCDKPVFLIM
jgi:hypothetical protein